MVGPHSASTSLITGSGRLRAVRLWESFMISVAIVKKVGATAVHIHVHAFICLECFCGV